MTQEHKLSIRQWDQRETERGAFKRDAIAVSHSYGLSSASLVVSRAFLKPAKIIMKIIILITSPDFIQNESEAWMQNKKKPEELSLFFFSSHLPVFSRIHWNATKSLQVDYSSIFWTVLYCFYSWKDHHSITLQRQRGEETHYSHCRQFKVTN